MTAQISRVPELDRYAPVGSAHKRSPVLMLGDPAGSAPCSGIAAELRRASIHSLITAPFANLAEDAREENSGTAERAWARMEDEFHSASLGLVATSPRTVAAASRILARGWNDGSIPGAIVLLAYAPCFAAACLELATQFGSHDRTETATYSHGIAIRTDWPPIMILLPSDDPAVAKCVGVCGRLRAAGIPVDLEVFRSTRQGTDASAEDPIRLIDRFFARHLVPHFPKIF